MRQIVLAPVLGACVILVAGCVTEPQNITCVPPRCTGAADLGALDLAPASRADPSAADASLNDDLGTVSGRAPDLSFADLALITNCDPVAQTGCPAGERCVMDTVGKLCIPLSHPPLALGAICGDSLTPPTVADDCGAGDLCIGDGESNAVEQCEEFCNSDSDCTQPTFPGGLKAQCQPLFSTGTLGLCSLSCDPIGATAGCPSGSVCYLTGFHRGATQIQITACTRPGTAGDSDPCVDDSSCQAGFVCLTNPRSCARTCVLGVSGQCPGGTCSALAGQASPQFGFCM